MKRKRVNASETGGRPRKRLKKLLNTVVSRVVFPEPVEGHALQPSVGLFSCDVPAATTSFRLLRSKKNPSDMRIRGVSGSLVYEGRKNKAQETAIHLAVGRIDPSSGQLSVFPVQNSFFLQRTFDTQTVNAPVGTLKDLEAYENRSHKEFVVRKRERERRTSRKRMSSAQRLQKVPLVRDYLPPYNAGVSNARDVYPLDDLILEEEWPWLADTFSANVESDLYYVERVRYDFEEDAIKMQMMNYYRHLCWFLSLRKRYCSRTHGRKTFSLSKLYDTETSYNQVLHDELFLLMASKFCQGTVIEETTYYYISEVQRQKIICYVIALILQMSDDREDGSLEVSPEVLDDVQRDLRITREDLLLRVRSMGLLTKLSKVTLKTPHQLLSYLHLQSRHTKRKKSRKIV